MQRGMSFGHASLRTLPALWISAARQISSNFEPNSDRYGGNRISRFIHRHYPPELLLRSTRRGRNPELYKGTSNQLIGQRFLISVLDQHGHNADGR